MAAREIAMPLYTLRETLSTAQSAMHIDNLLSGLAGALLYSVAYAWLMWKQIQSSERTMRDLIAVLREERNMFNNRFAAFESALLNIQTLLKQLNQRPNAEGR
jgi:hypothetical protein